MRRIVVLVSVLVATSAFAGKEGAPRTIAKAGVLGRVTGISIRWQRVPLADGNKGMRADVYRRGGDGTFALKKTIVTGTHKSGVKFTNTRDYVPVAERPRYVPAKGLREKGMRRRGYESSTTRAARSSSPLSGMSDAVDGMVRSTALIMAILGDRVDTMSQTTKRAGGANSTRTRYGFKDATVESRADGSGFELPFKVVK